MKIWTIANQKGGVGKTTTAIALAGLAVEAKQKVLLVDMDPHGSLTAFFRLDPETLVHSTFTLFESFTPSERAQPLSELSMRRCLCETNQKGLFLLPASTALTSIDRCPSGGDGIGLILKNALALVFKTFDLVIIDGPPMAGVLLVNAVLAGQQLIIPTQTEYLAVQGLSRMLSTLDHITQSLLKFNSEADSDTQPIRLPPYLIVPTMHDRRTQASMLALNNLREQYGRRVWSSQIATDTKLRDAMALAMLPHKTSDESSAVNCYRALYEDLYKLTTGAAASFEQQFQR